MEFFQLPLWPRGGCVCNCPATSPVGRGCWMSCTALSSSPRRMTV